MSMDNLNCYCGHIKVRHLNGSELCDICMCSKFRMDLSTTQKEQDQEWRKTDPINAILYDAVPDSGLKDSGERLDFASGMVRDVSTDKPRFDLVIPEGIPFNELLLTRWAEQLRKGAIKYSERNWEKADSDEELNRAKESAFRHFMQWFVGETDEDHAAAVLFNINEVETIKYKQTVQQEGNNQNGSS